MTRPKTRTTALTPDAVADLKKRFGTFKNAYATLNPAAMTMDVFLRVAAGRASSPEEVTTVLALFTAWKNANLK